MCAVVVPGDDMVLLKTDRKIVTRARDYEYVGVGDSSLLRHINHLIGNKPEYRRVSEALPLGVYLVMQAKRYIDGCGGDTDAFVIRPNATPELRSGGTYNLEQHLLHIERYAAEVVRAAFDPNVEDAIIDKIMTDLAGRIKDSRATMKH